MKYHIVQVNERIEDISRKYNVSIEEIIKLNRHINNVDYIVPGMKLRLPILSDQVNDEIKDHFLDIEKYYPKIEDFKEAKIEKKNIEEENDNEIEEDKVEENDNQTQDVNQNVYPNQNQQQYQQYMYNTYQSMYYQQVPMQPYYYQQQPYQMPPMNYPNQRTVNYQDIYKDDLTYPSIKEKSKNIKVDSKYCNEPAFCDPILLNGISKPKQEKLEYSNSLFQQPLYNPPYPCGKEISEEVNSLYKEDGNKYDNEIKEIKVDLRDFVKKNTKIRKKKDDLDLL